MSTVRQVTADDIVKGQGASVSLIWDSKCQLGESPYWDRDENRLHFLDIIGGGLFTFPLGETGERRRWSVSDKLSSFAQTKDGTLFGTTRHGLVTIDIPTDDAGVVSLSDFHKCGAGRDKNRFNDGKAGPAGTYWAGTMDDEETGARLGALQRFRFDKSVTTVLDEMIVPNGPAFSPCGRIAYFADSARQILFTVTLDETGQAGKPEPVLHFEDGLGYPDGMSCDAAGNLWIAFWDGHCVRRFSPDFSRIEQFDMPVPRPTSMAIVQDRLYVTSARVGLDEEALAKAPLSGGLFALDILGVTPGPDYRFWT
jgi:sugar lactone lactonase YvrE